MVGAFGDVGDHAGHGASSARRIVPHRDRGVQCGVV